MADENLTPRVPPHSEEAEQSVLGSMLMDRDAVNVAVENLSQEDFYNLRHGEIFGAMVDLYHENRAVDLVTLKNQLEQKGKLEAAGDMKYLSQIAAAVPNSVHIKNYVQIVKDKSLYRKFIQLGNQVMAEGYSTETPIDVLSEEVEQKVFPFFRIKATRTFPTFGTCCWRPLTISSGLQRAKVRLPVSPPDLWIWIIGPRVYSHRTLYW